VEAAPSLCGRWIAEIIMIKMMITMIINNNNGNNDNNNNNDSDNGDDGGKNDNKPLEQCNNRNAVVAIATKY